MEESLQIASGKIKTKALELGFSACGITRATPLEGERDHLTKWLAEGMHGNMGYMANHLEKRLDPSRLVEGAQSVISLLTNYYPEQRQQDPEAPRISKYAYSRDYHFILKEKLAELLRYIQTEIAPCQGRGFVDSAPVLERALAREAGLGWIGKHSLLISKYHGSYIFLSELIIDLPLEIDRPFTSDQCGTCTRCIDACPTQAIIAPRVVDARRCISYHTIENKEEAPESLRKTFQNHIFGCDICQDVCPWNRVIEPTSAPEFTPTTGLLEMSRTDWIKLDPTTYKKRFKETPFERAGYQRLQRNIGYSEESF